MKAFLVVPNDKVCIHLSEGKVTANSCELKKTDTLSFTCGTKHRSLSAAVAQLSVPGKPHILKLASIGEEETYVQYDQDGQQLAIFYNGTAQDNTALTEDAAGKVLYNVFMLPNGVAKLGSVEKENQVEFGQLLDAGNPDGAAVMHLLAALPKKIEREKRLRAVREKRPAKPPADDPKPKKHARPAESPVSVAAAVAIAVNKVLQDQLDKQHELNMQRSRTEQEHATIEVLKLKLQLRETAEVQLRLTGRIIVNAHAHDCCHFIPSTYRNFLIKADARMQVLGLQAHPGSRNDVDQAYRKKALKLHPDKSTGDMAKFQELGEARDAMLAQLAARPASGRPGSVGTGVASAPVVLSRDDVAAWLSARGWRMELDNSKRRIRFKKIGEKRKLVGLDQLAGLVLPAGVRRWIERYYN